MLWINADSKMYVKEQRYNKNQDTLAEEKGGRGSTFLIRHQDVV